MVSNHQHTTIKIYVEGGGDQQRLKRESRHAFGIFFDKLGFHGRRPRVVPCGSRNAAFDDFCTSLKNTERTGEIAFLLVDSEDAVASIIQPWQHLQIRDRWVRPDGATNDQAHLMIECMENWFLADQDALRHFFGQGFRVRSLPANTDIEKISKSTVLKSIENASRQTQKGKYGKGDHSFKILEEIDATKVLAASPSLQRLIDELNKVL